VDALFWETIFSTSGDFWATEWSHRVAWICSRGKLSELLVQCNYRVRGLEHGREAGDISYRKTPDTVSHVVQQERKIRPR